MRGYLLFLISLLLVGSLYSQDYSVKDLVYATTLPPKKQDGFLTRNKFIPGGSRTQDNVIVNIYNVKPGKKKKKKRDTLNIMRRLEASRTKTNSSVTYITSLKGEFLENKRILREGGFFCGNENDSSTALYQKRNLSVLARIIPEKEMDTLYSMAINAQELPLPDSIQFAEDLLQFYSHEYLVSVFGSVNVVKDLYYFSETEVAKCSVLFPKTNRQAVFIWEDNVNLCKPAYLVIGGNMNASTISNYDGVIGENIWSSKEGIYSGMSLNSLMTLNGSSFKFYGKDAESPYLVLPENTGAINFKSNRVVLGCLNPGGSRLLNNKMVSADEIVADNLGIYVYMMLIMPSPAKK
ncbi:MAG TPA: hypothetical protein VF144_17960 [Chitinophagaceae bacterium]